MRDPAEGNSSQGDSLLSLEADEEKLGDSEDDAEVQTPVKKTEEVAKETDPDGGA